MTSPLEQCNMRVPTRNFPYARPCTRNERLRLNRRVEKGELVKVYRGIYVPKDWWVAQNPLTQHACLAHACSEAHPDWIFCHTTAAALWNLNPPYTWLGRLHVAVTSTSHPQDTSFVQFHRFERLEFTELDGLRVIPCERTAVDCMRTLPFLDGLVVADSAVRNNAWDDLHLARYIDSELASTLHGLARAKLVALLADGRSESGGESVARGNIIRCGFALPELQTTVIGRMSGRKYRVDFSWPAMLGERVVASQETIFGELDGRKKYLDKDIAHGDAINTILDERRRESELTLECRAIVRFSYQEARSTELLSAKLDAFGVPRTCRPLSFTKDSKHNTRELVRYLKANASISESAAKRLAYKMDVDSGLPY